MRECPKCGFIDPHCWKNIPHKRFTDYCYFEQFKDYYPELWILLKNSLHHTITVKKYRYHLSKAGYVSRMHILDAMYPNRMSMEEPPMEAVKHRVAHDKRQRRLINK